MTAAAALLVTLLGFVASLGLFRVSGFDVGSWLEGTAVARLAKATGLEPEPVPEMGEAPEVFMGDVAEHEEPVDAPDVVVAPAE